MEGSQISAALENLSQIFTVHPEKARAKQATAIATLESGLTCRVVGPGGARSERLAENDLQRRMKSDISCRRRWRHARHARWRCIGLRVGKTANEDGTNSNQEWTHDPLLRAVNFGDRRFIVAFRFADERAIEFHDATVTRAREGTREHKWQRASDATGFIGS